MPLLLLILLIILVAQVGFWDTLSAILGATLIVILFFVLAAAAIAIAGYLIYRRLLR